MVGLSLSLVSSMDENSAVRKYNRRRGTRAGFGVGAVAAVVYTV